MRHVGMSDKDLHTKIMNRAVPMGSGDTCVPCWPWSQWKQWESTIEHIMKPSQRPVSLLPLPYLFVFVLVIHMIFIIYPIHALVAARRSASSKISQTRYDPENTEEAFANEKNGRMVFGVVLADEDKRKFTEGLDFSDWATGRKSGGKMVLDIYMVNNGLLNREKMWFNHQTCLFIMRIWLRCNDMKLFWSF